MSDIMYNEALIDGKLYQKGDWRKFCIHNDKEIKGFFGNPPEGYRWLSNFFPCEIYFKGYQFKSTEAAYQAAKTLDIQEFIKFIDLNAVEAKRLSKYIQVRDDWENIKLDIMFSLVFQKFNQNFDLRQKLMKTGNKHLEESNYFHDLFWGTDYKTGQGENHLGKILMRVRNILL